MAFNDIYQSVFGTAPTAEQASAWQTQFAGGGDAWASQESQTQGLLNAKAAISTPAPAPISAVQGAALSGGWSYTPTNNTAGIDVNNWYRGLLGRDADQSGVEAWNTAISNMGVDKAFDYFKTATAGEMLNPNFGMMDAYQGVTSNHGNTIVDEWGRNVLGRELTQAEKDRYATQYQQAATAGSVDNSLALYNQFLNDFSGEVKNPMDYLQASRLTGLNKQMRPPPGAPMQYAPNFASAVDAPTETIEGRMERLLAANNPVIRQAGDRAMQAFADRGLLNSSMAQQASYEAMVSKAIEIAGPDAERYFSNRRQNVDWTNKFAQNEQTFGYDMQKLERSADLSKDSAAANHQLNTQTNYQQAIANVQQMHAQQLAAVQGAQMDPQDKQFAIENMTVTRDNSIRLLTATFQQFPGWQSEWSALVSMLPSG